MKTIKTTMEWKKSTKGTQVFCDDLADTVVPSLYIRRAAFDNEENEEDALEEAVLEITIRRIK